MTLIDTTQATRAQATTPTSTLLGARAFAPALARLLTLLAMLLVAMPAAAEDAPRNPDIEYGRLVVIANFDNTEIQINGVSYPYEWIYADQEGVLLPAGRRLEIVVSASAEQRRTFRLTLAPDETRVLVVDIENMGAAPAPAPRGRPVAAAAARDDDAEEDETGYLGVSSSPRGMVHVDGTDTGERTPARRIPLEPGRHEVQIYYDEEGVMSETKHVLIRAGVNTNVFFRLRREQLEEARGGDQDQ